MSAYRFDIDALRALAVGLVVLFHTGLGFSGGYVGVDVFFVISGFLIIGIIHRDSRAGTFSLAEFFRRRIRRIAPASMVMTAIVLVFGVLILEPPSLRSLASTAIANQVFLQNFYFVRHVDYFEKAAELMPLLHTWSLAVEEQFYLLIPFAIFLLRGSRVRWLVFLVVVFVVSLAMSVVLTTSEPHVSFFLLPSRAWELAAGGILAVHGCRMRAGWASEVVAWLGIGMILIASLLFGSETEFPGFLASVPVFGTILVIYAGGGSASGLFHWICRSKLVSFLGRASYSIYLWHWPIIAYYRYYFGIDLDWQEGVMLALCSIGAGWLSYRYVETTVRFTTISLSGLVKRTCAVSLVLIGVGIFCRSDLANVRCRWYFTEQRLVDIQEFGISDYASSSLAKVVSKAESDQHLSGHIVLWGDSHGMSLEPILRSVAKEAGLDFASALRAGTPPLRRFVNTAFDSGQSCESFTHEILETITTGKPELVILVARWEAYFDGAIGSIPDLSGDRRPAVRDALAEVIAELQEAEIEVAIVLDPPRVEDGVERRYFVRELWGCDSASESDLEFVAMDEQQAIHRMIREIDVPVLDPWPVIVNPNSLNGAIPPGGWYLDFNHISTKLGRLCFRQRLVSIVETRR